MRLVLALAPRPAPLLRPRLLLLTRSLLPRPRLLLICMHRHPRQSMRSPARCPTHRPLLVCWLTPRCRLPPSRLPCVQAKRSIRPVNPAAIRARRATCCPEPPRRARNIVLHGWNKSAAHHDTAGALQETRSGSQSCCTDATCCVHVREHLGGEPGRSASWACRDQASMQLQQLHRQLHQQVSARPVTYCCRR